jgi:hypothetical protein
MNRLLAITNTLLAVIAICLVLVVVKVYDVEIEQSAHAAPTSTSNVQKVQIVGVAQGSLPVLVTNSSLPVTIPRDVPVSAQLWYRNQDGDWEAVLGNGGALATTR